MSKMADTVQRVLDELNPLADIVVGDALLPWIVRICEKRNVPAVFLWAESASSCYTLYKFEQLDATNGLPEDFSGVEELTYLQDVSSTHIAGLLPNATTLDLLRAMSRDYYWFHTAHSVLTTSFDNLESSAMTKIRSDFSIPIYPIGPLIPHRLPPSPPPSPYLQWLDSQPESSVLYVSLGSFLSISDSQLEEIAMGLMESKVKFLWVLRDKPLCVDEDTGLVLPWCHQLRVLCHSSVGGFLTHCGWNSTLEAVFAGVPMITYPLFWDQQPNSKLVVEDWGIGVRLKEYHGEEIVRKELVVKKVRKLMDLGDEESKGMRERAARLKEMCGEALGVGGSSQQNLDDFLKQFISRKV
ncbi:UDP-glycosyltransferase 87A2-like isoform X2 [Phalaenopsis equestris]|uniref:UDP-glycosyltransferase 87A2-like isoform X2 n=1 Tax=Phalaenopsis equestris TaxID=78828 RepID=UPI0009E58084|nr:UDP-glycosyltransferase 87A2-like isoform X2 [Phalaenopsis equestris]